jgi:hypothetical protein
MFMLRGTTNGFRYTESLIGASAKQDARDLTRIAVVPLHGGSASYAVARNMGRQVAKRRGALGFWRLKALK